MDYTLPATITTYCELPILSRQHRYGCAGENITEPVDIDMPRWRNCDLAYLVGNLVNSHTQIQWAKKADKVQIQRFVNDYKVIIGMLGELHTDVFSVVKQNGLTYDDITAAPSSGGGSAPVKSGAAPDGVSGLQSGQPPAADSAISPHLFKSYYEVLR